MPPPVAYIVAVGITAFVTGYAFKRFVYEPHIAPVLERLAEDYLRSRRLAAPVDAGHPPPGGDIPLNERRRRPSSSTRTSDEGGDEESAPLLGPQSSTTAIEEPNATLRRRAAPVVPSVDNTISERSAPLLGAHSPSITREESNVNENVNSTATLPRRPVAFDSNNSRFVAPEHYHQVTAVPTQDNRPPLGPTVTVPPSPAPSGVSRSDVHEWRRSVAREDRRRHGQGQPMRRLPPPSTAPAVSFVPTLPPVASPPPAVVFHVLDEPNPDTLPQTPIYPTHVITDSSVPSTPSSTMSGGRDIMFTPPPQLSPLRNSAISTNAGANGANGASGTHPSEINVLDPWNGAFSSNNGMSVSLPSVAQSATAASFHTDGSGGSSSTSQLLVPPPTASGAGVPPQLPPLSPLSSMHASAHSAHSSRATPVQSPQLPTLRSPPPQTPQTPPYLLTPSAQHPHHAHFPAPPNIAAVASSPTTTRGAPAAPTQPPISPPLTSPVLSLSQSYPMSLDQEQGIEIVSNPTPSASPFRSPTFSDQFDLVGSPGPFGSPGSQALSPQSPFIPLSIPPLPISPPLPPSAGRNGTGGGQRQQRQPLDLLGSAGSMTTTIRQPSSLNPPPQSPSTSQSMFYSFTNDGTTTTRQTSPPARSPPAVQSGGILSFPAEVNHNHNQPQHRFASPGVMSPMLSELDFVSEFGGSELGSNDDIGSESSWSSARF